MSGWMYGSEQRGGSGSGPDLHRRNAIDYPGLLYKSVICHLGYT